MTGQMTGPSKSRYYTRTKGPEEAKMNKWKKVMTGQSGTGPMTGQMTGPSKSGYYTQTTGPKTGEQVEESHDRSIWNRSDDR